MRQLKQEDFPGKKRMRADVFALENYERIRRRLTDFGDRIHAALKPKPKRQYRKRKPDVESSNAPKEKKKKNGNDDYQTVEEKWGKRDPSTPKINPKIGQFQQSPKVPLRESPTIKVRNEKKSTNNSRRTSAFFLFLNKRRRVLKRKYRNDEKVVNEATKIWKSMSSEEIEKYQRMAKDKDISNAKFDSDARNLLNEKKRNNSKKLNSDMGEWCQYQYKRLLNKGNDCWLNTMLQCINHLTIRNMIVKSASKRISPLMSALIRSMRKMEGHKASSMYPDELHNVFQDQINYTPHTQNDIHESFSHFLAFHEMYENVMTGHFQHEIQYTKICQKCKKREHISPDKFTTAFIPLCESVTDVSDALYKSYKEDTMQFSCETCQKDTEHIRIAALLSLPDVLLVMFKRFTSMNGQGRKLHSEVHLQKQIALITDQPYRYNLRACALHHGEELYSGHYTSLLFEEDNVVEVDDTRVKCVTNEWENRASSTVYLAFYCKEQNRKLAGQDEYSKHIKIDPTNSNKPTNMNKKITTANSSKDATENLNSKGNDVSFQDEVSIIKQTKKTLNKIWDISMKDTTVCNVHYQGYNLLGIDFKTLELSRQNTSYQREKPGWLNDNIIDAYLELLTKSASGIGKRIFAFSCLFYSSLRKEIRSRNIVKLYRMVSKYYKKEILESYDFLVFPINIGGLHWCIVVIDMWNQKIFYYDPLHSGVKREAAITNIKFFLTVTSTARMRLVKFGPRQFVSDFMVCWENQFILQTDGAGCGVFILMYAGTKLGLISISRTKKENEIVRTIFAYELLQSCIISDKREENVERSCKVMSLFRQEKGVSITLHCMTVGLKPKEFVWLLNNQVVFRNQTPKFQITQDNAGTYICKLNYDDGTSLQSLPCTVECTEGQIHFTLDAFEKIFDVWFKKHVCAGVQ